MRTLGWVLSSAVVSIASGLLVACYPDNWSEDTGSGVSNVEATDPLEGAYLKQGGTEVNFVFKRGETKNEDDTFLGEIENDEGEHERASGTAVVGRDNLGTTLTLKMAGKVSKIRAGDAGSAAAGDADAGAPVDTRPKAQQAFNGTMHFLKIGKNQTILVRGDANGKTAHYKKVKTWCREDSDCASDVQKTGLDCAEPTCSTKGTCGCP
jgi:hypothetical protein